MLVLFINYYYTFILWSDCPCTVPCSTAFSPLMSNNEDLSPRSCSWSGSVTIYVEQFSNFAFSKKTETSNQRSFICYWILKMQSTKCCTAQESRIIPNSRTGRNELLKSVGISSYHKRYTTLVWCWILKMIPADSRERDLSESLLWWCLFILCLWIRFIWFKNAFTKCPLL